MSANPSIVPLGDELVQGSIAWHQLRLGKVTASRLVDVLAKIKSGESASRANYRAQLVAERLTGVPGEDHFENAAIKWGHEQEPFARSAYEVRHNVLVDQAGFIHHPTIEWAGGSPDGLVGADGGVEIKCRMTKGHIETVLSNTVPNQYIPQIQWLMACSGRKWFDYVSFDPRLPDYLTTCIIRVPRDDSYIAAAEREVRQFLAEVEECLQALGRKAGTNVVIG